MFIKWDPAGDPSETERSDRNLTRDISRRVWRVLQGARPEGLAGSARCQPDRGAGAGRGHVYVRQEQDGVTAYRRVLHQRDRRNAGRGCAGCRREVHGHSAGGTCCRPASSAFSNYVALPPSEAFRIEYWKLEEAKIRRQPAEKELSRKIALIVGGGSGIGREVALLAAERGAHIVIADRDVKGAEAVAEETKAVAGKEAVGWTASTSQTARLRKLRWMRRLRCSAVSIFSSTLPQCSLRRRMASSRTRCGE